MGLSVSYHISTGKKGSSALSCADKHNERKYRKKNIDEVSSYINFNLSKHNVILIGSKNLYKDVKELYNKEFKSSVDEYNSRQKRADRKIYDYFEKISNDKKTNLYTELVIQIGDMDYWKDKTLEERKKMVGVFKKQLELSQEFYPNFKIANATVHLDESSPHIHVIGVCSSNEELSLKNFPEKKRKKKNGLKNYVSQNEVFTQNNMKEFHQFFDKKSVEIFNEVYKTNEILNDKKIKQEYFELKMYKELAPKIKKYQKEYESIKQEIEDLKNELGQFKEKFNLAREEIKNLEKLKKEIELEKLPRGTYSVFDDKKNIVCIKNINENRELNNFVSFFENGCIKEKINFKEDCIEKTRYKDNGDLLYDLKFDKKDFFEKEKEIDKKYNEELKKLEKKIEKIENENPWEKKFEEENSKTNDNPWGAKLDNEKDNPWER